MEIVNSSEKYASRYNDADLYSKINQSIITNKNSINRKKN